MATKDEINMMAREAEKCLLQGIQQQNKLLSKQQREYKKVLSLRLKTRYEQMLERSHFKAIEALKAERKELRADIYVAEGRCHQDYDQRSLEQIQCHIKCQEHMSEQIKTLKIRINNMERERGSVDKQIYGLNRRTVPDSQHQNFVALARKRIALLENSLEVSVRRECIFRTENSTLQDELKTSISNRMYFHDSYSKLVQKLNTDKKYLLNLLEYVSNTYSDAIDVNDKITSAGIRIKKDREHAKIEIQGTLRTFAAADLANDFMDCKNQRRTLAKLQPPELKRRAEFKRQHVHKISLYNNVLLKLFDFVSSNQVETVIEQYQHQESLYYSYFSLSNELSFHISLVRDAVDQLFDDVSKAKEQSSVKLHRQKSQLSELEAKLVEKKRRNEELKTQFAQKQNHLEQVFKDIAYIFNLCQADAGPLLLLLGKQTYVNLYNAHGFLRTFEKRILNIVRTIYIKEREVEGKSINDYIVKELVKPKEYPTKLDDIVLTQQCPECAEGETINMSDGDAFVVGAEETRQAIFEKVNQPDMQYRLHNVSQCRLPRSRLLAAKRND